jgi:transcriptional regulator with XRE-family HTH domain
MLTSAQVRSARHALRLSVAQLSDVSGVSTSTIKRLEADDGVPMSTKTNLAAVKAALEAAGIEFIGTPDDGPGIRIHKTTQSK